MNETQYVVLWQPKNTRHSAVIGPFETHQKARDWKGEHLPEVDPHRVQIRMILSPNVESIALPTLRDLDASLDLTGTDLCLDRRTLYPPAQFFFQEAEARLRGQAGPEADPFSDIPDPDTVNQCDGCAQDLPIKEGPSGAKIHYDPDGSAYMVCTKDRYRKP